MINKPLAWLIPAGIAVASLILWNDLLDPEQAVRFLYLTIFGAVVLIMIWKHDRVHFSQSLCEIIHWKNPIFVCMAIWLTAAIASLPNALQKSEGYVEISRIAFFLFSFVWVSLAFKTDRKNVLYLSTGICIAGFLLASIGLKDFLEVITEITGDDAYYQMGNMGNRNLLAIMISLCLPFHFILFQYYKSPTARTALAINFLLIVSVVMISNSRVGWLGIAMLFLACTSLFLAAGLKGLINKKIFIKLSIGLSAFLISILGSLAVLLLKNSAAAEITKDRMKSLIVFRSEQNIHTESINERLHIWSNSVHLIKKHPITGVGAGNWKFRYAEQGLPERAQKGSVVFLQPHNDFLWVFSETGVIGGMAFTMLFVLGMLLGIRQLLHADGVNFSAVMAIAAFTGTAMYAVHSFFDFPKERPLISFTFASILAIAGTFSQHESKNSHNIKSGTVFLIALIAIALFTSWIWAIRIQGELNLKKAIADRQSANLKSMKKHLDQINPTFFESDLSGTPIDWYRSEVAYLQHDKKAFKKFSESSIQLNPYQLYNLYNLGSIYYKEGDLKSAMGYWEKAVAIAPRFTDAAVNLSAAYYNQKNYERAAELLSLPVVNYQNESYSTIVAAVLGKYINLMSDTVSSAVIKEELLRLSFNAERVRNLQGNMAAKNQSPRDVAILQAIRAAEIGQNINSGEAALLRIRYGLDD